MLQLSPVLLLCPLIPITKVRSKLPTKAVSLQRSDHHCTLKAKNVLKPPHVLSTTQPQTPLRDMLVGQTHTTSTMHHLQPSANLCSHTQPHTAQPGAHCCTTGQALPFAG